MSHTPGPYYHQSSGLGESIRTADGTLVGWVCVTADGPILAAASCMLAALEDTERVLELVEPEPKPVLTRVRAAIAKAKVESGEWITERKPE